MTKRQRNAWIELLALHQQTLRFPAVKNEHNQVTSYQKQ